ncbi:MAG: glycosyltransferase family 39 protein, partial [Chloroflexota bacterium]
MRLRRFAITLLMLFAGFAVRLALHAFHGLEGDDAFSLALSRTPTPDLIRGLMRLELDVHPPLHFLALKTWVAVAGESLLALRLLNILLDVLTGALMVRLARGNVLAALLWAVAPLLIFGGWLARMYTLLGLLVMLAAVCALQATRGRFLLWVVLAAVAALAAMYTHILGVVAYGAVVVVLFFCAWGNRRRLAAVVIAFAVAGALYLPFALPAYNIMAAGGTLGAEVNPANTVTAVDVPFAVVNAAFFHRLDVVAWLLPLVLVLLSVAYVRSWRQTWPVFTLFWVMAVGFVILGAGAGLFKPRYLVALAPVAIVYTVYPA